jgi:hypothetical protein
MVLSKVSPAKRLQSTTSCLLLPKKKSEFKNSTCVTKSNKYSLVKPDQENFTPLVPKKRVSNHLFEIKMH